MEPTTIAISGRSVSFGRAVADFGLLSTDTPSADSVVAIGFAESLRRSEVV
jgi:hypothetical protein